MKIDHNISIKLTSVELGCLNSIIDKYKQLIDAGEICASYDMKQYIKDFKENWNFDL